MKLRCKEKSFYNITIGKVYEGTIDETSAECYRLVMIKDDRDVITKVFLSRFDVLIEDDEILEALKGELLDLQSKVLLKAKEINNLQEKIEQEKIPRCGSRWKLVNGDVTYILSDVGGYTLVNLLTGRIWKDPVSNISDAFGTYYKFEKVK